MDDKPKQIGTLFGFPIVESPRLDEELAMRRKQEEMGDRCVSELEAVAKRWKPEPELKVYKVKE